MRDLFGRISLGVGLLCVLISAVVAVAAYEVGQRLSATYQSSGVIRVGVISEQGVSDPVVLGANDITSQYAQLVGQTAVTAQAARILHVAPSTLSGAVTGSTVGAQNLLEVTTSGPTPDAAESRAKAAMTATLSYLRRLSAMDASAYLGSVRQGLATALPSADTSTTASVIVSAKAQTLANGIRDAAANQPTFQVVSTPTSASESSPKPKLYALVALLVALLVTFRVAYLTARALS